METEHRGCTQVAEAIAALRKDVGALTGAVQELSLIAEEVREVRHALLQLVPALDHFHHLSELRDSVDQIARILRS